MATQVQFRGGTTAQNNAFTGASKELTVDTDKDVVVVHDGTTAGGHPLMAEDGSNSALALGSAGTPALKFTDTNTGIYSPGPDQIALSTAGTGRLFIDSSGNIGVNTSSPAVKTHISNSYSAPTGGHDSNLALIVSNSGSANNYTGIGIAAGNNAASFIHFGDTDDDNVGAVNYFHDTNSLTFVTAASEQLRITSAGNIGIGNSAPSAKLQIEGTSDQLKLTYTSIASYIHEVHSNGDYSIAKDGSERLRINAGGVLSMGDPITNGGWRVFVADEGTANQRGRMTFRAKSGTNAAQEVLQSYVGTTENFRLRADGGGFFGSALGVGTSSAASILHTSGASDQTVTIQTTTAGADSRINFRNSGGADAGGIHYKHNGNHLAFNTGGSNTESARIDGSGRLLVGTSTAATQGVYSQYAPLTVQGYIGSATGNGILNVARGTAASLLSSGSDVGTVVFSDSAGGEFGRISCFADAAPGANDYPGRIGIFTTPDGSTTPLERFTVKSDGTINFANVQTFADDAAAGSGGLVSGDVYKTSAGDLKIKA